MKFTFNLDPDTRAKLQALAQQDKRSVGNLVQLIIHQWLNHHENHQPQQRSKEQGE